LIGLIFKHSLILPVSEKDGSSVAVNLMSTDIERIQQTLQWVLTIIPNFVQVGLGLWILGINIGGVTIVPVLVAISELYHFGIFYSMRPLTWR
jgi:hypothetical protein